MTELKHAKQNYQDLRPILEALPRHDFHISVENEPYTRLAAEFLYFSDYKGRPVYYIAHYSEQNGNLMADPEIEFAVDEAEQTIEPVLFCNDYTGSYDEVYKEVDGQMMYSQRLRVNLDEFLHIWLKNLKQQGFIKLIKEM
jgi:hypothetical protein